MNCQQGPLLDDRDKCNTNQSCGHLLRIDDICTQQMHSKVDWGNAAFYHFGKIMEEM